MPDEVVPNAGQDGAPQAPDVKQPAANPPVTPPADNSHPAPAQGGANPAEDKGKADAGGEFKSMLAADEKKQGEAGSAGSDGEERQSEDFEITVPDGVQVDPDAMAALKDVAKEVGMDKAAAEKCLQIHVDAMNKYEAHKRAEGTKQIEAWETEIRQHPEFGGPRLEENVEAFKLMVQKYGSPRLQQDFKQMGVYSHPEFAFMVMRMSRDLSEHRSVGGSGQAMPEAKNPAKNLFPDFK